MAFVRIIPRIDIKGPNLVKGIHLEGLRVLGRPDVFARYFCESGADELIYMDVVASLYGRNSLKDFIAQTSREIFVPLTVGGGLRSLDDIRDVLRAGADKVSLNTAAINNPDLVAQAARHFGSSTVLVSIEAARQPDGSYEAYTDNGRMESGRDVFQWAREVERLGAGEIMITSIDREGTGSGYDVELTRRISESAAIPVIACGGAGQPADIAQVIKSGKADAVSAASVFHYDCIRQNGSLKGFTGEGNVEYLQQVAAGDRAGFSMVEATSIRALKRELLANGINCRMDTEAYAKH